MPVVVEIEQLQHIKIRVPERPHDYPAQILDKNTDTLVVRVPDGLLRVEDPTQATLFIGHRGYQYDATVPVLAVYEDWWFLKRPSDEDFQSSQRRENVRIKFQEDMIAIPTDIRGQQSGAPLELKLRDLSATGCFGFMKVQLEQGTRLMLVFALPGMPILSTISQVVRVAKRVEMGGWYGLRFETLPRDQVELLTRFINARIQLNLREGVDITIG